MIKVIMGSRGTGKTKKMIEIVNKAVNEEAGNVVCIEKGQNLRYNLKFSVKLIDVSEYPMELNYDTVFAYICGVYSGNYDITHIFIDSLYKLAGDDNADHAAEFLAKLERFSEDRAIALEDLKNELQELDGPIFLVGDGSKLCYDTLSEAVPELVLPQDHRMHQRASGVALAALRAMERGESGNGAELTPNYLRLSQAERERLERENKGETKQ